MQRTLIVLLVAWPRVKDDSADAISAHCAAIVINPQYKEEHLRLTDIVYG